MEVKVKEVTTFLAGMNAINTEGVRAALIPDGDAWLVIFDSDRSVLVKVFASPCLVPKPCSFPRVFASTVGKDLLLEHLNALYGGDITLLS